MKRNRSSWRSHSAFSIVPAVLIALVHAEAAHAHGTEARYVELVEWKKENIIRTSSAPARALFRVSGQARETRSRCSKIIDNKAVRARRRRRVRRRRCVRVRHRRAGRRSTLTYATEYSRRRSSSAGTRTAARARVCGRDRRRTRPRRSARVTRHARSRALRRARARRAATSRSARADGIALCDIKVARSNTTQVPTDVRHACKLTFKDAKTGGARAGARRPLRRDRPRAARVRQSADAAALRRRSAHARGERAHVLAVAESSGVLRRRQLRGPRAGRHVRARRDARARVPCVPRHVRGEEGRRPATSTVALERYADLPAKGWYSGDSHIHVTRDEVADPTIWGIVAAEDVYVGNLLEMGNIARHALQAAEGVGQGEPLRARRPLHRVGPGRSAHAAVRPHDSPQPANARFTRRRTSTSSTTRSSRSRSARAASRASRTWAGRYRAATGRSGRHRASDESRPRAARAVRAS